MPRILRKDEFLATCLVPYTPPSGAPNASHRSAADSEACPVCPEKLASASFGAIAPATTPCTHQDPSILESQDCTICLDPLTSTPIAVTISSCNHAFHETCLKIWLERHNTCCTCRQELFRARGVRAIEREQYRANRLSVLNVPRQPPTVLPPLTWWVMEESGRDAQRRTGAQAQGREQANARQRAGEREEGGGGRLGKLWDKFWS